MKKSTIIILVGLGLFVGVFVGFIPSAQMERHVDILAPQSIVEEKIKLFKTYFDSASVSTFTFSYKTMGDTTRLTWVYADPEKDDPIVKIYWFFNKTKWQNEVMDKGLRDIKSVAEKANN